MPAHKPIPDEVFVTAWESLATVREVCAKLGLGHRAAISRAWRLRQAGVKLTRKPKSVKRSKAHVTSLNRLIQKRP